MSSGMRPTGKIISPKSEDKTSSWDFPQVTDDLSIIDEGATNALGKNSSWQYEPPEDVEVEEVKPLTAEDIEAIRQSAFEEGFNQGKEEGFSAGYNEGKEKGHEDGHAEGIELGKAEGLALGQEEVNLLTTKWTTLIEQLSNPLALVDEKVCNQLLSLVSSLTEAVVLQEAKTNPEILLKAIKEGVKALPLQEAQTTIILHPEDIAIVEDAFTVEVIEENGWRILPEPALERGSCQIENSTSQIDYQIKNRLKEVIEPFLHDAAHTISASE